MKTVFIGNNFFAMEILKIDISIILTIDGIDFLNASCFFIRE